MTISTALRDALSASVLDRLERPSRAAPKDGSDTDCRCRTRLKDRTLLVDATDCEGSLAESPACRRTVVESLTRESTETIVVRSNGLEYRYDDVSLLAAAGRFVDLLGERDERLAELAGEDPLAVVTELEGRCGEIADIGTQSGLTSAGRGIDDYDSVLWPRVGLSIGHYYVDRALDDTLQLRAVDELETGSTARIYERADAVPLYELEVVDLSLGSATETVLEGYEAIAEGEVDGDRAPSRALESVSDGSAEPVASAVLSKHTSGYGILEDLFADPRISDVYATSPLSRNPIRVVVDGETMATNVYLTETGANALASRVRRTSGRPFSRAAPTVDATAALENGTDVRIAGVTDPVADGLAFAFREQADDRFTLPELVRNGTMSSKAAGFLSTAIERSAATLIAGTRGAGKTTLLGTLLYELPSGTRTVVIEDTPELPIEPLQSVGRDVQQLRTGGGDGPEISPVDALKTALRLGDGALVVGEIRGEEAEVLYEAMRVGANANAVLGTIHGDGAADVYERVVSDLGVEPSSFSVTDLVVTVQAYETPIGRERRLARIEEVIGRGSDVRFEPLYVLEGDRIRPTGRIDRGESRFIDRLAGPRETYADVRDAIESRSDEIATLARDGRTSPSEVAGTYAARKSE